jgi:hypothetical protein
MLFAFLFRTFFAPMDCPSQGRRRSNLHWAYPQGPLSRVLHLLPKYCTIAIEFPNLTVC